MSTTLEHSTSTALRPPLKWLGGKFTLLDEILPKLAPAAPGRPESVPSYIEPFVGAGNVALNIDHGAFGRFILADANPDLPNLYNAMCHHPEQFDVEVSRLFVPENNTLERYLALRGAFNELVGRFDPAEGDITRAGLFAYLNRHCFNGLCRYNRSGGFNAHFGAYKHPAWPVASAEAFRSRLGTATFTQADWRDTLETANAGDVVYCDPPYLETFSQYSRGGFSLDDHVDLAKHAKAASERGVRVIISNSMDAVPLYDGATVTEIEATTVVSRTATGRGKRREILVVFDGRI